MRSLTAGALAALASGQAVLALLLEMLTTPPLRLTTLARSIDWNGFTWLPGGALGEVQPLNDTMGQPEGLQFALSHVPTEFLSLALGSNVRNAPAALYLAILNADTQAIEDVSLVGSFVLDQTSIAEQGASGALGVTALPLARVAARPKPLRYTDAEQQRLHPGDLSLQYVVSQSTHKDVWPAASFFRK